MPISINNIHIHLEMSEEDTKFFREQMPMEVATKELKEFKDKVKKQRKLLAKKYHPDKNPKHLKKMQTINYIVDEVMKIEIRPQIQQPTIIIRSYTTTYNTSTTGTWTGW